MMSLEAKQREMRKRNSKCKHNARAPRGPKLERGITVAPVRRQKPIVDFPELQALLCAHLRSPKIKASEFANLLDLGTRYGLVLPNIRPIPAEEAEAPNSRQDLSPEMREVLLMEKQMREQRKKEQETKKTQ